MNTGSSTGVIDSGLANNSLNDVAVNLRACDSRILPLPPHVAAKIVSSVSIVTLTTAILELLKNSLDAGASNIELSVNFPRGSCVVEDNGAGILPVEFKEGGSLGKANHTSKLDAAHPVHGQAGCFISSLAALSLLTITSKHHEFCSHNTVIFHNSKLVSRSCPVRRQDQVILGRSGTRVIVRDLFGNFPVRVKQRALGNELASDNERHVVSLKKELCRLLLGWNSHVTLRVQDSTTSKRFALNGFSQPLESTSQASTPADLDQRMPHALSLLTQASYVSHEDWRHWVPIAASTPSITIKGLISLKPGANRRNQYISLGIRPVSDEDGFNELYTEINRIFDLSSFGIEEDAEWSEKECKRRKDDRRFKTEGFTNNQLRSRRKGIDRWPMFCLWISFQNHSVLSETSELSSDGRLQTLVELVGTMAHAWLCAHQFRVRSVRRKSLPQRVHSETTIAAPGSQDDSGERPRVVHPTSTPASRPTTSIGKALVQRQVKSAGGSRGKGGSVASDPRVFQHWSRIKSSSAIFHDKFEPTTRPRTWDGTALSKEEQQLGEGSRADTSTPSRIRIPPVCTGDVTGTSAPAEHLRTSMSVDHSGSAKGRQEIQRTAEEPPQQPEQIHGTFAWINPANGARLVIDARTGMVSRPCTNFEDLASSQNTRQTRSGLVRLTTRDLSQKPGTTGRWMTSLLQNWENPTFKTTEERITQSSSSLKNTGNGLPLALRRSCAHSGIDIDLAFQELSRTAPTRVSKDTLRQARIIAQVDSKFILAKIPCALGSQGPPSAPQDLLVLIDQHAADERCRVEMLADEIIARVAVSESSFKSNLGHVGGTAHTLLSNPIVLSIARTELDIVREHAAHFAYWGIVFDIGSTMPSKPSTEQILIRTLPVGIAERCRAEPHLLESLIRSEFWSTIPGAAARKAHLPPVLNSGKPQIPLPIMDLLNSRACRSAIMFNDSLSLQRCEQLVADLADCKSPFTCAHGRPSLVPLVELGEVGVERGLAGKKPEGKGGRLGLASEVFGEAMDDEEIGFAKAWKRWRGGQS